MMTRSLAALAAVSVLAFGCSKQVSNSAQKNPVQQELAAQKLARAKQAKEDHRVDHLDRKTVADHLESSKKLPDYQPLDLSESDFHAIHYKLNVSVPPASLEHPAFEGQVEITFKPLKENFSVLMLDSSGLEIQKVTLLNTMEQLRFEQQGEKLAVDLSGTYQPTDTLLVRVAYRWHSEQGVYFRARTGKTGIEAIYSQSEPDESKFWFPGNMHPNDRSTFEAIVSVPEPFIAVSNGALVDHSEKDGMRTYHWSIRTPMPSYLFVVTAGRFGMHREEWDGIPIEYYGQADETEKLAYSLRATPDALSFFSNHAMGLHYPYEKYAQVVVPQYMWGGMEHTTATTLTDRTIHDASVDEEYSSELLLSHEMAHQWFGDLMTCRSWDHLWLNEGFATFFEMLYSEHSQGKEQYLSEIDGNVSWYQGEEDGDARPVVFPYFRYSVNDYFDGHAYGKGGITLHALRSLLGDEAFFKGIRHYVYKRQGTLVQTADFQKAMEEVSGRDLGWFFTQWLLKPGYPKFSVSYAYDANGKSLKLQIAQKQDLTAPGGVAGTTPLFMGPIDVDVAGVKTRVELKGQAQEEFSLPAIAEPAFVHFNAGWGWAASHVDTVQPLKAWQAQLAKSLDVTARVDAADALAAQFDPRATNSAADLEARVSTLLACGQNDASWFVRTRCMGGAQALLSSDLATNSITVHASAIAGLRMDPDYRVRRAVMPLLAKLPAAQAFPVLKEVIKSDAKIRVVSAALNAVGALKAPESFDLLVANLGRASHLDVVQGAVLSALGTLSDLRALSIGEEYTTARYADSARIGAYKLLVSLGLAYKAQASERARLAIETAFADPSVVLRENAIPQLVALKNKAAIPALQKVAESDPVIRVRGEAAAAVAELQALP